MPLPLAPLLPVALRLGAVAAAGWAAQRLIVARSHPGRTDQRAEDAFDALDEGLAAHRPADRPGQSSMAGRLLRTVRIGARTWEVDAALMARLRIRRIRDSGAGDTE